MRVFDIGSATPAINVTICGPLDVASEGIERHRLKRPDEPFPFRARGELELFQLRLF